MSAVTQQKMRLASLIGKALHAAMAQGDLSVDEVPEIQLETPRDTSHGDFATNIALLLAKPARKAPRQIAELLANSLPEDEMVDKVEVAGPGFINFFISNSWLYQVLTTVCEQGLAYGSSDHGRGQKVLLEFVSANPVGPMNVVNARAAAIGDTLGRLLTAAGYEVAREYYVNDAGNQTETFGRSLEARLSQLRDPDYPFPDDGYPGGYLKELAQRLQDEHPEICELPLDDRLQFCRRWGIDQMVETQRQDLQRFNVHFDRWFREQELHSAGALDEVIQLLTDRGYIYTREGALWFRSTAFDDDKDRVIVKTDSSFTYVTADIAYHYDKLKRGFTKLIDLLGPDHHGYIGRMQAAVQALGYPCDTLEILILQYVALLRDGEQVKMSKRAGEFITLRDVIDEVGRDAARYFFLMRSLESHLDFDLTLAAEQSSENPVFYIQYAHARICSILAQAQDMGLAVKLATDVTMDVLTHSTEIAILRKLAELPDELVLAAKQREPHRIARYALDLAGLFHSFYTHCRVLGEPDQIRDARLILIDGTRTVLHRVLDILGIDAPQRM